MEKNSGRALEEGSKIDSAALSKNHETTLSKNPDRNVFAILVKVYILQTFPNKELYLSTWFFIRKKTSASKSLSSALL